MTKKDIADIAFKALGLYFLPMAIFNVGQILEYLIYFWGSDTESLPNQHLPPVMFQVIFFLFCFWLLTFKTSIVIKRLKLDQATETLSINVDKTDLLQIVYSIAGILILFFALTDLWREIEIATRFGLSLDDVSSNRLALLEDVRFSIPIVKIAIALVLFFASKRLARLMS
jgi:hypothetical protein